ncbi:bifunctional 2-polyprenyl-6-hydroxyphenol methylase/3-demethylubiquinol 3-O-methyltransferase UbiG [Candidatus Paracaedibacter symbiosus]|uniref:bifunctional 2-polyprenyl-6-hydroxyphenol methylase/3-demethylubiquinol 3-O-methyltransferase UbiG n=1 Tax=Candidatus Paracaedibacter symbiosus TaxID=244582 RepID=UPI000509722F|nr:bifunctional 2-polyprenyl-6-hydroxyphenol methylase/3-demethylubiquinol 3-O-methyltransferase UbiG [Candidatus Paracaedibacter symbiosus]
MQQTTLNDAEIEQFSKISHDWWDENGPFKPLHDLNPTRLHYIVETLKAHLSEIADTAKPLAGVRLLDIGCGGGLISEPMCRLGADVVGVDASDSTIEVAKNHSQKMGLTIDYRNTSIEAMHAAGEVPFDIILALEVVEHVADVQAFIDYCLKLLKPGGALILSTINRTWKAYGIAIIGAEYIMRWLPRGTHDWNKFLTPAELANSVRLAGGLPKNISGMSFCPLTWTWSLGQDLDVNYLMYSVKID